LSAAYPFHPDTLFGYLLFVLNLPVKAFTLENIIKIIHFRLNLRYISILYIHDSSDHLNYDNTQ